MAYVRCPECNLPARIIDRFSLGSTSGPVEHVKTSCPSGHWFTPRLDDVIVLEDAPQAEPLAPGRAAA
ncbi:MAG TPA: hypothetical protein VGF25_05765 [Thermoleophilaceae bacterium]|jgi:hypothetical protein